MIIIHPSQVKKKYSPNDQISAVFGAKFFFIFLVWWAMEHSRTIHACSFRKLRIFSCHSVPDF